MSPRSPGPDRRRFLGRTAAGLLIAAHGHAAADERKPGRPAEPRGEDGPRIRGLELVSAAPLGRMKEFYHRTLGLRVAEEAADRLTLHAGLTRLTFRRPDPDGGVPFYHFAFNIPENKARAAHRWQAERTPLLPIPERLRDPDYPPEVVNYAHWNAHSVFFLDPAGNVVEYIARHDLKNPARGDFGPADILYASEIAFVVDDVAPAAAALREAAGADDY